MASSDTGILPRPLTIAQICLANARRDEAQPEYRYGKREKHYFDLIDQYEADVYAIKEVRPCLNETGDAMLSNWDILSRLAQRRQLCIAGIAPSYMAKGPAPRYDPLCGAQLYNPDKLLVVAVNVVPAGPNLPCFLRVRYVWKDEQGEPMKMKAFEVESFMFPMANAAKTTMLDKITETQSDVPVFRVGDFNFFRDDADHEKHLEMLALSGPVSWNIQNERGEPMYGTFFPFPHDVPPVPIDAPWVSSQQTSWLDYAFCSNYDVRIEKTLVIEGPSREKLPWDHLPLICTFV